MRQRPREAIEIAGWFRGSLFNAADLAITGFCEPLDGPSGDYICIVPIAPRRIAIVVLDATGHGLSAAGILDAASGTEDAIDPEEVSPARILEALNLAMHERACLTGGAFITGIICVIDLDLRRLTTAIAGHPPPTVLRAGMPLPHDWPAGLPLGIAEVSGVVDILLDLRPGDSICLFTDGLTDSCGPDGSLLGHHGVARLFKETIGEPDISTAILDRLDICADREWQRDDTTLIVCRVDLGCPSTTAVP